MYYWNRKYGGCNPSEIYKFSICCSSPEVIACLEFKWSKSKFQGTFHELIKLVYNIMHRNEVGVVGAIPYESMGYMLLFLIKHNNEVHAPAVFQKPRAE